MKKNYLLQQLYDMANSPTEEGLSKFDEQKLRREMEGNKNLMARNKDIFEKGEPKFRTCKWYDPCPICDKCKNKASHLYVRCQNCKIPNCVHSYKDINKMIRRDNFWHRVPGERAKKAFQNLKRNLEVKENE